MLTLLSFSLSETQQLRGPTTRGVINPPPVKTCSCSLTQSFSSKGLKTSLCGFNGTFLFSVRTLSELSKSYLGFLWLTCAHTTRCV